VIRTTALAPGRQVYVEGRQRSLLSKNVGKAADRVKRLLES
jgi:hypothetical protein